MEANDDLNGALEMFHRMWENPSDILGERGRIDYWEFGRSYKAGAIEGPKALKDWWSIYQWDTDIVLAREYVFNVPIGDGHTLHGTVDKLAERTTGAGSELVIIDFKTAKRPTYDYLAEDLQFSAYALASTLPEFWLGLPNGEELYKRYKEYPRRGEWVQLRKGVQRMDAGLREQNHWQRLVYAINALANSIALGVFVPNISGETCKFCNFRTNCGLKREDNGN
jgi:RecB family exonuclease